MTSEDFIVPYVFVLKRYKVLPTSLFVLSGTTVGVGGAKKQESGRSCVLVGC